MQSDFHGACDAAIRWADWQYITLRGTFCPRGARKRLLSELRDAWARSAIVGFAALAGSGLALAGSGLAALQNIIKIFVLCVTRY